MTQILFMSFSPLLHFKHARKFKYVFTIYTDIHIPTHSKHIFYGVKTIPFESKANKSSVGVLTSCRVVKCKKENFSRLLCVGFSCGCKICGVLLCLCICIQMDTYGLAADSSKRNADGKLIMNL